MKWCGEAGFFVGLWGWCWCGGWVELARDSVCVVRIFRLCGCGVVLVGRS